MKNAADFKTYSEYCDDYAKRGYQVIPESFYERLRYYKVEEETFEDKLRVNVVPLYTSLKEDMRVIEMLMMNESES